MAKGGGTTRSGGSRNPRGLSGGGGKMSVSEAKIAVFMNIEMARNGENATNALRYAMNRASNDNQNTMYFNSNESFNTNGDRFEIQSRTFSRDVALQRNYDSRERGGHSNERSSSLGERFTTVMSGSLTNEADVKKAIDYIKKKAK